MAPKLTRRRMIRISAAAAGMALLPAGVSASSAPSAVSWRGRALGGTASITINHPEPAQATRLFERVEAEVRRLERIFSLYRSDSEIVRLNRGGTLHSPSPDLVALLEICRDHWKTTNGRFDPSIQPLWLAYQRHFRDRAGDEKALEAGIAAALPSVGFDGVFVDRNRIVFGKPNMGLTLNGIAQGYITDLVVDMLRDAGMESCLADLGECRALGSAADGSAWRVGIEDPWRSGEVAKVIEIRDRAVATSSPRGFRFEEPGRFNHLIDPRSGLSAHRFASVAVVAPRAADADALSTAFSLMEPAEVHALLRARPDLEAHLMEAAHKS